MMVLVLLIGCSLLLALGFLAAFFWAVKSKQFDDTYTPSMRVLFDDEKPQDEQEENDKNQIAG